MVDSLIQTIPLNLMSAIMLPACDYLSDALSFILKNEMDRLNMDLSVPALLNGIIPTKMPTSNTWKIAYESDSTCKSMIEMTRNPAKINTTRVSQLASIYRAPMRDSRIKWEDDRLCYLEHISHSDKFLKLIIVPVVLQKMICVAFHVNPIGGHFSLYYTHHRIRLRYIWPGMWQYIKAYIIACAAWILATKGAKPQ